MTRTAVTEAREGRVSTRGNRLATRYLAAARSVGITFFIAATLGFAIEAVARGSIPGAVEFFTQPFRPAWTGVAILGLMLLALDALLGRAHLGVLLLAPPLLALAATANQKAYYLGDPLYPTDFLYGRQIVELIPLLARERIGTAILIVAIIAALAFLIPMAWMGWSRRARRILPRERIARLALAVPLLAAFATTMDYSNFSWVRDRLWITPMMWDQTENYRHNGFAMAFALNLPMANVDAPAGYSADAIDAITPPSSGAFGGGAGRPDIVMVMSESMWDPTRLPGVVLRPDPIPAIREAQAGHVFSPEFGGMTANVEFEALTGFSNAFLPYGSIPYQQYIRGDVPSLATFFNAQGYDTTAVHPFEGWFWNRKAVYDAMGFDRFLSEENMPRLEKRGQLAGDMALTEEIIEIVESADKPSFLFAVTLQNHGPYEPKRYPKDEITVAGVSDPWTRGSIASFAQGMADTDKAFQRLIEWAEKRERPTIVVLFGDHLPPLGPVYVNTRFLPDNVAPRSGTAEEMKRYRETPLVVWSSEKGYVKDIGTVSPSYLPMFVLREARMKHPYYTDMLERLHAEYPVVDRHQLIRADGTSQRDWARAKGMDAIVTEQRLLQYDMLFGERFGAERYFPKPTYGGELVAGSRRPSALPLPRNPV